MALGHAEVLSELLDAEQTGKCFGAGHRCLLRAD